MRREPSNASATVKGTIERLFYSTPAFTAGRILTDEGDVVSFAGKVMVREQDPVVFKGTWERHPKFGLQLKVDSFTFDMNMNADGLAHYLGNHPDIKGIGPVRAKRIASLFAADFDNIIREEPERVAAAAGVPLDAVMNLRTEWMRRSSENAAMVWLAAFELTHHQMSTLIKKYGNSVVAVLQDNPYRIINEIHGFGFKRVDDVALKMGGSKTAPNRLRAGLRQVLVAHLDQGDCWVEHEALIAEADKLLALDTMDSSELVEQALDAALEEDELSLYDAGGRWLIAFPHIRRMEEYLAEVFRTRLTVNHHVANLPDGEEYPVSDRLNDGQRVAIRTAYRYNMALWSGGAGSGKSFTVAELTLAYLSKKKSVALCAPTGKAVKRMEESLRKALDERAGDVKLEGRLEAATLHRLLGYDGTGFAEEKLQFDVVIIDEVSMVDVALAYHFFKAVDFSKTVVVMVGDHNQLPPVGPGNVLRDLIDRQPIPTVILDQVVRQAGVLKENCLAILRGEVRKDAPCPSPNEMPWILRNRFREQRDVQAYIVEMFEQKLTEILGFDLLRDVQVLSPQHKGDVGVSELNVSLQRVVQRKLWGVDVQPPAPHRRPRLLLHDRVIQTRNNYEIGVMNGSIGIVVDVGRANEFAVRFDDRVVAYPAKAAGELELAYCLTVHKSQGSEFPCVIVVMHKAHSFMAHRNLLYTAVTRARKTAIIVGDHWGITNAAQTQQTEKRKTFLSVLDGLEPHSLGALQ